MMSPSGISIEMGDNIFILLGDKKKYIQKNLNVNIAGLVLYNYSVKVEMFNKFADEIELSSKDYLFQKAREYYILS